MSFVVFILTSWAVLRGRVGCLIRRCGVRLFVKRFFGGDQTGHGSLAVNVNDFAPLVGKVGRVRWRRAMGTIVARGSRSYRGGSVGVLPYFFIECFRLAAFLSGWTVRGVQMCWRTLLYGSFLCACGLWAGLLRGQISFIKRVLLGLLYTSRHLCTL